MPDNPAPRPMRASRVSIAQIMQPEHANPLGNVHGGHIMRLADEAGALACMRHAHQRVVTVAIDQMEFHRPILIGNLVTLTAQVTYAGRTSMEAQVEVVAENPITGEQVDTNTAYLVYVALDETGSHPVPVPPLLAETPEEEIQLESGKQRQAERLARRKRF
jgi:uncharacterized protein (TIGR00369 family)